MLNMCQIKRGNYLNELIATQESNFFVEFYSILETSLLKAKFLLNDIMLVDRLDFLHNHNRLKQFVSSD